MNTNKLFITPTQAQGIAARSRLFTEDRAAKTRARAIARKKMHTLKETLIRKAQTKTQILQAKLDTMRISVDEVMNGYAIPEEHKMFLMKLTEKMVRKEVMGKKEDAAKVRAELQRDVGLILGDARKGHPFAMYLEWAFNTNWDKVKKYFPEDINTNKK